MPGCPRYLVWLALAVHGLAAGVACSADPESHAEFLDGACAAGQRNYRGFCLTDGSDPGTMSSGIMGRAGHDAPDSSSRDAGGADTAPGDAGSSA